MRLPGFTATAVFTHRKSYRAAPTAQLSLQEIEPATYVDQNCLKGCKVDCGTECAGTAGPARSSCIAECSSDNNNCTATCTVSGNPPPPPTGGGPTGESFECQIEETFHPLGTEILDKLLRIAMGKGVITSKTQCYTAMKAPAAIAGAAAGGASQALGHPWSDMIGALAGYNIDTLGQCICDRYF